MSQGQETDLFKQLEKISKKLDKSLSKIEDQSLTIYNLNLEITKLNKKIEEANKLNERLKNEIDRLKNKNNKNSSNSSKPSSTDISKPKKSGANLYNYRTKSDNKVGGQKGHIGYNLSKKKIEDLIVNKKIEVREINHTLKGNSKQKPKIKYTLGIDIKPYVEKHIFNYNEKSSNTLPEKYYTDVTYDNSIKALSIELGTYNVVAYDRLSDFFSVITKGIINISNGTLVNFNKEFSNKAKKTISNIENNILDAKNINTDETSIKYDNKNMYVRNYSTENDVLYKSHLNKGHKPILEDNILPRFFGEIMADHDTTIYSYGTKRYECNIHL